MASKKKAIELVNQQMNEVGQHYGGKGTTGSADSRERQSRQRRTDTIKAVRSVADDRRLGGSKMAPKTNRTTKMHKGDSSPKATSPSTSSLYGPRAWTKKPVYGPEVPAKKGIRK